MSKATHSQSKHLSLKEIQSMPDDDVIKYVYLHHIETGISVEDVWQGLYDNFEKQTLDNIRGSEDDSWNNDKNFEPDGLLTQVGVAYLIVFGIIWIVLKQVVSSKSDALGYALGVGGVASIFITIFFMRLSGKNERNYFNARNKLQRAYSIYVNRGFNDLTGKPLDYVKSRK
jgi:hypothetical protein